MCSIICPSSLYIISLLFLSLSLSLTHFSHSSLFTGILIYTELVILIHLNETLVCVCELNFFPLHQTIEQHQQLQVHRCMIAIRICNLSTCPFLRLKHRMTNSLSHSFYLILSEKLFGSESEGKRS